MSVTRCVYNMRVMENCLISNENEHTNMFQVTGCDDVIFSNMTSCFVPWASAGFHSKPDLPFLLKRNAEKCKWNSAPIPRRNITQWLGKWYLKTLYKYVFPLVYTWKKLWWSENVFKSNSDFCLSRKMSKTRFCTVILHVEKIDSHVCTEEVFDLQIDSQIKNTFFLKFNNILELFRCDNWHEHHKMFRLSRKMSYTRVFGQFWRDGTLLIIIRVTRRNVIRYTL
jgi:hypothetical protein